MTIVGPWYITARALADWSRLHDYGEADRDRCRTEVLELARHARFERADAIGRHMWRVDPEHGGFRLVVSNAHRAEGKLPQVLWIGKGRPTRWCWSE